MNDALFLDRGFVYWNVDLSPEGSMQVPNGFSGGAKSATIVHPRVANWHRRMSVVHN